MIKRWRAYAQNRPLVAKILGNSGWQLADRVVGMAVGLFVGLWVARYLQPELYGRLQFCLAFSGIFGGLAALGLDGLALRDFVSRPEDRERTLATILVLRMGAGVVLGALSCGVMWMWKPAGSPERMIMLWLAMVAVLQSTDVVNWYFQSQYRSEELVRAKWAPVAVSALLRVVLILGGASVLAFGFAEAFGAAALALAYVLLLRRSGLRRHLIRPDWARAKELLSEGWGFALSVLSITIFMKIDQVMLGTMSSARETGLYASAAKISELWYFVPVAVTGASFPAVVEARAHPELYKRRFQELHDLMFTLAFPVALGITFFAPLLVRLLFGQAYMGAVSMLRLHIWAGLFVAWGLLYSRWLTAEGRGKLYAVSTIASAVLNIGLNVWMIPAWGGMGAALATLIAYGFNSTVMSLMVKESRFLPLMQLRSIGAPWRLLKRAWR